MLNATSGLLMFVGPVVLLIGTLMFYVAAFRTSVVWGLVCLLLPPACPVFLIIHWGKAKRAFTVLLVALAIMFAGLALDISLDPGGLLDIAPRAPSGDYDLAGEIIKYEPDPAYVGDKVAFTYLVKNIGKDPVPALAYMVELYVDKERLFLHERTSPMEPGEEYGIRYSSAEGYYDFIPEAAGRYSYSLVITARHGLVETNSANNKITGEIVVLEK
jgi:hypothetical protein